MIWKLHERLRRTVNISDLSNPDQACTPVSSPTLRSQGGSKDDDYIRTPNRDSLFLTWLHSSCSKVNSYSLDIDLTCYGRSQVWNIALGNGIAAEISHRFFTIFILLIILPLHHVEHQETRIEGNTYLAILVPVVWPRSVRMYHYVWLSWYRGSCR